MINSSSDMSIYLSYDPTPFALAFWIENASETVCAAANAQQEPQLPWFITGVKQPLYSCLKSYSLGRLALWIWSSTYIVFTSSS